MTTPIIQAAEKASDSIRDNWHKAFKSLEHGGGTNGYGILYDPSRDINRLHDAKEANDAAISAYRATHWPTDAEYDHAEEVASERQRQLEEDDIDSQP